MKPLYLGTEYNNVLSKLALANMYQVVMLAGYFTRLPMANVTLHSYLNWSYVFFNLLCVTNFKFAICIVFYVCSHQYSDLPVNVHLVKCTYMNMSRFCNFKCASKI